VETIPEEIENGAEATVDKSVDIDNNLSTEKESAKKTDEPPPAEFQKEPERTEEEKRPETPVKSKSKSQEEEESTEQTVLGDQHNDDTGKDPGLGKGKASDDEDAKRSVEEVKVASSLSFTASKDEEHLKTTSDVLDIQTEDVEERKTEGALEKENTEKPIADSIKASVKTDEEMEQKENHKDSHEQSEQSDQPANKEEASNDKHESVALQRSVRKRKWLSKKVVERAQPVLAITTDSLKNIISDVVNPVPLSDVQLESSSEEEGLVTSDHETDDRSLTPELRVTKEREQERDEGNATDEEQQKPQPKQKHNDKDTPTAKASSKSAVEPATNAVAVARSPSPARNRASHVLYITNLVRPFTVLQLKGLLARTGKIVEDDGFWIDRIKSKCFVAYATEE